LVIEPTGSRRSAHLLPWFASHWRIFLVGGLFPAIAIARLIAIWSGWLDGLSLADDAFYYFQIARHVAMGIGPTFDGLANTNGFHPLYLALLAPAYRVWPHDPWIPIHVALSFLVVCDLVSAWLLYRLATRVAPSVAGLMLCLLWLTSPVAIAISSRGMESSLSALLVLASALAYLRWLDQPRHPLTSILVGLTAGLAILARTEDILFVFLLLVHAAMTRPRQFPRLAITAALPFTCLVGPWFIWQWTTLHTFEQSSGAATRLFNIYGHLESAGQPLWFPTTFVRELWYVVEWLNRCTLGRECEVPHLICWVHLALTLATLSAALLLVLRLARLSRFEIPTVLRLLLAYAVLHVVYYYAIAQTYRPWYPLTLTAIILLALAFFIATGLRGSTLWLRRILLACILLGAGQLAFAASFVAHVAQHDVVTSTAEHQIAWLERNCGPNARIGFMNAGKIAYLAGFRSKIRIVNLDGVVNNEVLRAYQRRDFAHWYCSNLDYAAELPTFGMFRTIRLRASYMDFYRDRIIRIPTQPAPLFRFRCDP
jgi:4-amino-4-deoxy-L-arabinose transferase-like glycosyltransferase